jgi:hypothetical protein
MPDDPMTEACENGDGGSQVVWCPAWEAWLCVSCRAAKNDEALRVRPVPLVSRAVYPSRESLETALAEAELQAAATGEQP